MRLLEDLGFGFLIVPETEPMMWYADGLPKRLAMIEKLMRCDDDFPVQLTSRECRILLPLVRNCWQASSNRILTDFLILLSHAVEKKHTLAFQ